MGVETGKDMRRLQTKTSKKPLYSLICKDRKITAIRNSAQCNYYNKFLRFVLYNIHKIYLYAYTYIYEY